MSDYEHEIKLLNNNDKRDFTDIEWMQEFREFLTGVLPDGIAISKGHKPNLSDKKALTVLWYLQEHFPVFPDTVESCSNCGILFDSNSGGTLLGNKG